MLDTNPENKHMPRPWLINKVDLAPHQRQAEYAPLGIAAHYSNGLAFPVTVTLRNGVSFTVPPATGTRRYSKSFTIQTRYYLGNNVNVDVQRVLDRVDDSSSAELKVLKEAWDRASTTIHGDGSKAMGLDYHVDADEITDNGGALYLEALDIVLAYGRVSTVVVHPYSREGIRLRKSLEAESEFDKDAFYIRMRIVDDRGDQAKRFINFGGSVYEIPVVTNPMERVGLHVDRSAPAYCSHGNDGYIPMEQAKDIFSFYYSVEEAMDHGDSLAVREKELKEWDQQLRREELQHKAEHKRLLHDMDIRKAKENTRLAEREFKLKEQMQELEERNKDFLLRKAELDRQMEMFKHEKEMRSLDRKDYYESRSHQRKDSSETLKWLPTTVVAIGGILAAWKAIF